MLYCEKCRLYYKWPKSITSTVERCEVCGERADCFDLPPDRFGPVAHVCGAQGFDYGDICPACQGTGLLFQECGVKQCTRPAIPNRKLCERHAFPAEPRKSDRREAIEHTKRKKALKLRGPVAEESSKE